LIAAAACARGDMGDVPDVPDARLRPDSPTPCTTKTFYRDVDGDGHGNPMATVQACDPPPGTVASKDDCDDANPQRFPGNAELCDIIDNDCNAATSETCPANCAPFRRPAPNDVHVYLVCNVSMSWPSASTVCTNAMYKLVQIDDLAENVAVRGMADAAFTTGTVVHIGGTDSATEATWVWDTGVPFWQGGAGGAPIGGKYTNWDGLEPNDSSGAEDCIEMKADGYWNDAGCSNSHKFVCRR
jgi:hypothetical protein